MSFSLLCSLYPLFLSFNICQVVKRNRTLFLSLLYYMELASFSSWEGQLTHIRTNKRGHSFEKSVFSEKGSWKKNTWTPVVSCKTIFSFPLYLRISWGIDQTNRPSNLSFSFLCMCSTMWTYAYVCISCWVEIEHSRK